ncbi:MAG TPA: hypothetical protein VGQ64_04770 [Candidatus Limnocylindrales bacterium]|jgi:hypothetical protein|nr:hypothetical protein [Candidatus Limnocylindrales bacterium]
MHQRVSAIDKPVKIGAAPADHALEPSIKDACQAPHIAERDVVKSTSFDPHHDAAWDRGCLGDVHLSQPTPQPKRPQSRAYALVLHRDSLAARPYLALTGCRF